MKKLIAGLALVGVLLPGAALAKCYHFDKSGDIYVCVQGDSFPDRNKAKAICDKAKGSDCGGVGSSSSSCNGVCYDENGNKKQSLSNYN